MTRLYAKLRIRIAVRRDEALGAAAVEYGLMVALIAIVITVGVGTVGGALNTLLLNLPGEIGL